jgi:hypothetical protein
VDEQEIIADILGELEFFELAFPSGQVIDWPEKNCSKPNCYVEPVAGRCS